MGHRTRRSSVVSDRAGPLDPRLRRFGAQVRQQRDARGLTLEQLAERAGVGRRQLTRVEAGKASPSLIWMLAVADGLGTTVSDLVCGVR
jgi:transcriptional regulator with XRE-family HTH domain